jgi:hypothetical protein
LEVPNCSGIERIKTPEAYRAVDGIDHINAFSPATLRAFAARAGFAPVRAPVAHVTTDPARVVKREIKRAVRRFLRPTTEVWLRLARPL